MVDFVNNESINSNKCKILDLDLLTMNKKDVEFSNQYTLTFNRRDNVHAIVAWFDVEFSNLKCP